MSAAPPRDRQRLLPAAIRWPAAVLAACCAIAFLVLAVRYHGAVSPGGFDSWVDGSLPRRRFLPIAALAALTDIIPTAFLGLAIAAAIVSVVLRRWSHATLAVLGPGVTMLVVEVAKFAVGRLHEGALSLPSGHTAGVTSGAVVGALLLVDRLRGHPALAATVGAVATTVAAGAMSFVLVALRWHYATDTIAGYCVAVATTLGVAFAVDAIAGRRAGSPATRRRSETVDRLAQPSG